MLDVIQRQGDQLGSIFTDLFSRNAVPHVFAFLDEQTSWRENFQIMHSVTPWPFLGALGRVLWRKASRQPS